MSFKYEKIVVTRHKALYDYLVENNYISSNTKCMSKVDKEDIKNKHVFGILPNWLACKAALFTEVQMRIPSDKRNKELTIEDIRFLVYAIRTYKVTEIHGDKKYARKQVMENGKRKQQGLQVSKNRKHSRTRHT